MLEIPKNDMTSVSLLGYQIYQGFRGLRFFFDGLPELAVKPQLKMTNLVNAEIWIIFTGLSCGEHDDSSTYLWQILLA